MSENDLIIHQSSDGAIFSSRSVAQIVPALAAAQGKFRPAKRTKTATVRTRDGSSYVFSYAPLDEIVDAIKEGLAETSIARVQFLVPRGDNQYSVRSVIWHAGEFLGNDYPVIVGKEGAQGFAGACTYAKRQGLCMLLGIAPEDDDDANIADGNTATIVDRQTKVATRRPAAPAPNIMQDAPPKPEQHDAHAEIASHLARLEAAAQGRGGLPADVKLREEWQATPAPIQHLLQHRKEDLKQVAAHTDAAIERFQSEWGIHEST